MGEWEFTSPTNRVLSDQVANLLREAIVHGRMLPGQHIVERDIADAMRLSRGPVRDALRTLENEGLVVHYPHRGTFVTGMAMRDAEEIYSLREPLEMLAMDYIIRYATDEQLDELDAIVDQMAAILVSGYTQTEATELDMQFHDVLYQLSVHTRLQAAWAALRGQVSLLIMTHRRLDPEDFRTRGVEAHRQLVACLRQRDVQASHAVIRNHLASSFGTVAAAIRATEARLAEAASDEPLPRDGIFSNEARTDQLASGDRSSSPAQGEGQEAQAAGGRRSLLK